jgi:hypothetical protein
VPPFAGSGSRLKRPVIQRLCVLAVVVSAVGLAYGSTSAATTRPVSTVPPACPAGHLSATGFWEGATSAMAGTVWFTNTGTKSCSLRGYLPVTLRTQRGKALPVVIRREGTSLLPQLVRHPSEVVLAPGVQQAAPSSSSGGTGADRTLDCLVSTLPSPLGNP